MKDNDILNVLSSVTNGVHPTTEAQFRSGTGTTTSLSLNTASYPREYMDFPLNTHSNSSSPGYHYVPVHVKNEPVDSPSSSSQDRSYSDSEWVPTKKRQLATNSSNQMSLQEVFSPTPLRKVRRNRDEPLSPEEDARRHIRRERNKLAAAKCRQRRVDHTNRLITETKQLQDEQSSLEAEIQKLQSQKDELEFVLQAHQIECKVNQNVSFATPVTKTDFTNGFSTQAKPMPFEDVLRYTTQTGSYPSLTSSAVQSSTRPSSLSLATDVSHSSVTSALGIPISTPSSGYFSFANLDGFIDGSTGLTPINSNPCGRQVVRRESNENGTPDGPISSPSLITLG